MVLVVAAVALFAAIASAQTYNLNPGRKFCFHENLKRNDPLVTKFGVKFQVKEGTVGISMSSPSSVLYNAPAETYNSFSFAPHEDGKYTICFDNTGGNAPRSITFSIIGGSDDASNSGTPGMTKFIYCR